MKCPYYIVAGRGIVFGPRSGNKTIRGRPKTSSLQPQTYWQAKSKGIIRIQPYSKVYIQILVADNRHVPTPAEERTLVGIKSATLCGNRSAAHRRVCKAAIRNCNIGESICYTIRFGSRILSAVGKFNSLQYA